MRRQASRDPASKHVGRSLADRDRRRHAPSVAVRIRLRPQRRRALRAYGVIVRFAVARHGRVEINEASNAVGHALGDGRDHRSAVAVADQRDVVQVRGDAVGR